jgi:hypothetical protein
LELGNQHRHFGAALAEVVERAGADQVLNQAVIDDAWRYALAELGEGIEGAALTDRQNLLPCLLAQLPDHAQPQADLAALDGAVRLTQVDVRRQDGDAGLRCGANEHGDVPAIFGGGAEHARVVGLGKFALK